MTSRENIPEKKMAEITDCRYMLRYDDNEGETREPFGAFHRDDYFVIGVVLSGKHRLSVDFEEYEMDAGTAIVISPGQIHAAHDRSRGDGFVLVLSPELLTDKDRMSVSELQLGNRIITLPESDLADITALVEILKRRKDRAGVAELAIVSAVKSIVIENIKSGGAAIPGRYLRLVVRFRQMMEHNIRTVKSPSGYASMLNVSGVYLNEAVKAVTGRSASNLIGEFITMLAKRELCYTQLSAREIAFNLGFDEYGYFSRLFRHYAGISPKAFRDKYLE